MRVAMHVRGAGVGGILVEHLIGESKRRSYEALYLETGAMDFFRPARRLYEKFGFTHCGCFGDYKEDPNSVFMRYDF